MATMTKIALTTEGYRAEYKRIRNRAMYERAVNKAEFDAKVRDFLAVKGIIDPTPAQWVRGAEITPFLCRRCAGSGIFVTYVENGQVRGPGGECFRCGGHGVQTDADAKRNAYHDEHQIIHL